MDEQLGEQVRELAESLAVPGVAVGVLVDGEEHYAFHGVTSLANPLPVDETTLFQFGSTGKTYTATTVMRLVDQGTVDLDAPVRTYVPELVLRDADVAERVTVLQLLNHTAGWEGDMMEDTGDGDDALQRYVARMAGLQQVLPLGSAVSYNNASLSLAGRLIEKVTGLTFEQAVTDLVLEPLGMTDTLFFDRDIMTRRFAVGHTRHEDGRITVCSPWSLPRGGNPAGGMSATAHDMLIWARFHLGDGTAANGTRVLEESTLRRMQQPTVAMPGSALGDHVGISWLLSEVDGVRLAGHGGTTIGQYSDFVMAPERGFAFTSMSNCGPNGPQLNHALQTWALGHYLGISHAEPTLAELDEAALAAFAGRYETIAATVELTSVSGRLVAAVRLKPEMAAALAASGSDPDKAQPPIPLALLTGPGDRYVVPDGPAKGMKGYFSRAEDGTVDGVHLGGRMATRMAAGA